MHVNGYFISLFLIISAAEISPNATLVPHHVTSVGVTRSGSLGESVVRRVRLQSIPSSNIDSSAPVIATVPVAVFGQTKCPNVELP